MSNKQTLESITILVCGINEILTAINNSEVTEARELIDELDDEWIEYPDITDLVEVLRITVDKIENLLENN